jgi:ABC-type phosphate/phosphonate transport system substrate-binding protein
MPGSFSPGVDPNERYVTSLCPSVMRMRRDAFVMKCSQRPGYASGRRLPAGNRSKAVRKGKDRRRGGVLFFVALFFCLPLSGRLAQGDENRSPKVVKLGYSFRIFSDVDVRDVQVAMDMWARELNRIVGAPNTSPKSTLFQDTQTMVEAVRKQEIDVLSLASPDYLRMKEKLYIEPAFVAANQLSRGQQRLLLVRKDSGITRVSQLKDRTVSIQSRFRDDVPEIWLDTLLGSEGLSKSEKVFKQIRMVNKPSQAVLPLFFKQTECAVVSRSAFEILSALNPQLNEDLSVLASSKSLLGTLSCFHKNCDESLKRRIAEVAPKLHESPSLKQMFFLLQVDRIVNFQPSFLDGLMELKEEHDRLSTR